MQNLVEEYFSTKFKTKIARDKADEVFQNACEEYLLHQFTLQHFVKVQEKNVDYFNKFRCLAILYVENDIKKRQECFDNEYILFCKMCAHAISVNDLEFLRILKMSQYVFKSNNSHLRSAMIASLGSIGCIIVRDQLIFQG